MNAILVTSDNKKIHISNVKIVRSEVGYGYRWISVSGDNFKTMNFQVFGKSEGKVIYFSDADFNRIKLVD